MVAVFVFGKLYCKKGIFEKRVLHMSTISEARDFETLCRNLRMSDATVLSVRTRYHAITRRINWDFWDTMSDTAHSLYVGSYGRGTCIYTSDIDIIVELPWSVFTRYDGYSSNGQSALLQAVKNSLARTYPNSRLGGDGQVVVIDFVDGIRFEVVPAFRHTDGSYTYPDSNRGGSWREMDPRAELTAFNNRNAACNGNLKRLCRMARVWNEKMGVCMDGILIDTLAYKFLADYEYRDKSYTYYDWMSRDFFQFLLNESGKDYWYKFGSGQRVNKGYSFSREAREAHELAVAAINAHNKDMAYSWHTKWREIYGAKFPIS